MRDHLSFSVLVAFFGIALTVALTANRPPSFVDAGAGIASPAPLTPVQQRPQRFKLAFVTNNPSDYWTIARKGVEKAERELGIEVDFETPDQGTASQQEQIMDDLLDKGEQGIAVSPIDPANQVDFFDKAAKRTLLFTQDSDAPSSNRACFIGTDNVAAGRQAAGELKKALPHGGDIVVFVGKADARNAADRIQGLRYGLRSTNIKVLAVRNDETDRTLAKSNVMDALILHPHLAACIGIWSYNGPAILSALKAANKVGRVKVVCFDEERDTLAGVKSGALAATIVQQPFEFGYLSVVNMVRYLEGDKSVVPASHQIFVPTRVIDSANVDAFAHQLRQWGYH